MSVAPELAGLQFAVAAVEPAARLVSRRALRRVARLDRERSFGRSHAVHDRCWRVRRDDLFDLLTPGELGLSPSEPAPELLLLPAPDDPAAPAAALELWRTLFHAAVDRAFEQAIADGRIDIGFATRCRRALGPARWKEIRAVVAEENLIDEHDPANRVLREFTAFALEVIHFTPTDWDVYFPGIEQDGEPLLTFRTLVNSEQLHQRTRPTGLAAVAEALPPPVAEPPITRTDLTVAERAQVERWSESGNDVRAAVRLFQAGDASAHDQLLRLAGRLQAALGESPEQALDWAKALRPLLAPTAAGSWPVERRLLDDLQRACLALERPAFAADLVEWVVTLGRRPVKRSLPKTRWIEATRRLRAAGRYAERRTKAAPDHRKLVELTERAAHHAEHNARNDLRPDIVAVLDEVGLAPESVAERVSRDKLVEELLDAACDRGFLRVGDLRDAISRNRVKLPDLTGPAELFRGDPLIRANQKLPERLDGVYRRGEVYLRLLQRGCSIFFGTRFGRAFTRYVALPFGGAYLLIEAVLHMVEAGEGLIHWLSGWRGTVRGMAALGGGPAGTLAANPTLEYRGVTWPLLLVVGAFLFLMLHWPAFRRSVARSAEFVFIKLPRAVRQSAVVRMLFDNQVTRFFRHYLLFPLAAGLLATVAMSFLTDDAAAVGLVGAGVALLSATFFRTPIGREAEDRLNEAVARAWRVVSVNFAVGVLTFILQLFRAAFEAIDRGIHAVDEWLWFQYGQGRATFAFKLVFGAAWFIVTYVFRFAWNLLVEPQINPIKHFPVVTVSHKLLLPLIPSLAEKFAISKETMGTIVFGIPGIFGFLVWELRENWKLYRANAPRTLRPVVVGSHGEKTRALLRPGFHSGVVPKTLAKLRRAVRAGRTRRAAKLGHSLEHIAEAVHRFADREFVACLNASRRWGGLPIRALRPRLTPSRILLPFDVPGRPPVVIAFEELGGWMLAAVETPGWLPGLAASASSAVGDDLTGLYACAGVHAVRQQVARLFGPQAYSFDAVPEGLIIPLRDGHEELFEYDDGPELIAPGRRIPAHDIVFSSRPKRWDEWVERWEADRAGKPLPDPLVSNWHIVPDTCDKQSNASQAPPGPPC